MAPNAKSDQPPAELAGRTGKHADGKAKTRQAYLVNNPVADVGVGSIQHIVFVKLFQK